MNGGAFFKVAGLHKPDLTVSPCYGAIQPYVLCSNNTDKFAVIRSFNLKNHFAISRCKQGMIFSATYIVTRVKLGSTLTNDDIARRHTLSTVTLNT